MTQPISSRLKTYAAARGLSLREARSALLEIGLQVTEARSKGAQVVNSRGTPESRSDAARKAALTRWRRADGGNAAT